MKEQTILVSVPVIFRKDENKVRWFIVRKHEDEAWELPKVVVRKVESSVRASIRSISEQGGMRAQVYEEVGRKSGAAKVNGQAITQNIIYYLMGYKGGSEEVLEFTDSDWLEYSKAVKRLENKKDQAILKDALEMYKALNKAGRFDVKEEEELLPEE